MKLISPETLARRVREQAAADLAQRQQAKTILTPAMLVSGSGKRASSAATRLMTTLGGVIRPITTDDLHKFREAVAKLQSHEKRGGITVAEAIAQSRPEDLSRSKKEIPLAVPFRLSSGMISFQTSASRQNGESRHIVQVQLGGWAQAVGSPVTPLQAAKTATESPLRFECDCGRFKYWFRYIATIGGWNLNRPETGLPKIRNPELTGVACKHALRVMAELSGTGVRGQIARAIHQERQRLEGKSRVTVLPVRRSHAQTIATKQAAKPRDVERMAKKLRTALEGKVPASARSHISVDALRREAERTRARLHAIGLPAATIEQAVTAILSAGARS